MEKDLVKSTKYVLALCGMMGGFFAAVVLFYTGQWRWGIAVLSLAIVCVIKVHKI